ncbi:MAG: iron-sulfur cluster assembly scaffold protein [Deltaproteobacteria bacterium]|nr:iron-sulfur cluster assembly scaffold protein [Deltaproteobacteria bacterium]
MAENEQNKEEGIAGGNDGEEIFAAKVIRHAIELAEKVSPKKISEISTAKVIRHAMEPTHYGELMKPDGHAVITGPCGDTDEFFLRIFSGRIREIRFQTTGCFFTMGTCDAVASLAEGRTVREGLQITQESVIAYLGELPEDHQHCALLAVNTLHKAIRTYLIRGTGL